VILGFEDVAGYQSDANQYFGCTTGRVANRIAKGRFRLDGKDYQVATNNGPNHLHGGVSRSLDKVGVKIPVICAWAASSPELPKFAGSLANGVTVMQTYSFLDPNVDEVGKKVAADFLKKHDVADISQMVTPAFTAHAYDGMLILGEAIKRAKLSHDPGDLAADRAKIRDALENNLGPVKGLIKTYDPAFTKDNHDSVGPADYIMTVWQDGKLIPYKGKQDWGKKH